MWLFRTNLKLWLGIAAALFLAQSVLPLVRSGGEVFNYWTAWLVVFEGGSFAGTPVDTAMILVVVAIRYALGAAVVGWVLQRISLATRSLRSRNRRARGDPYATR
jgi:hypothetical protein